MRSLVLRTSAALALAAAAFPLTASAQGTVLSFGGGVAIPSGDAADGLETGWHAIAAIGFRPAALPVGLRFDVGYSGMDMTPMSESGFSLTGDASVLSGTANLLFGGNNPGMFRPYALAGVGVYRLGVDFTLSDGEDSFSDSVEETKFGVNGGVGFRLGSGRVQGFAEARYHYVFVDEEEEGVELGSFRYIPIAVGVTVPLP